MTTVTVGVKGLMLHVCSTWREGEAKICSCLCHYRSHLLAE